jgi:hypothetical protein
MGLHRGRSRIYPSGVRRALLLLLLAPSVAAAGVEPGPLLATDLDTLDPADIEALPPALDDGPPAPLSGVPIEFRCDGAPPVGHPLYDRHPGQDLHTLVRTDPEVVLPEGSKPRDPVATALLEPWLDRHLCSLIWADLAAAGAHAAPIDVQLPARAVLDVRLREAWLEGSREVEQRVGSTVLPISVPHWALSVAWTVRFSIEYEDETGGAVRGAPLELNPLGGAEQEDYTPLRLGALLRAATQSAFDGLPGLLADEGRLGDLLFAVVDRPSQAPPALGVDGALSESFWLLLSPSARARHDALAFYLSSERVPEGPREAMARWYLLHDSDLGLRRDALAWLMGREAAPERDLSLSDSMVELLLWLVARDPSPRLRAEVAHALADRRGPEVRELLLAASTDEDARVAEVAVELLRRFPPATAAELDGLDLVPTPPRLPAWTAAFDGRLPPPPGSLQEHLLRLAAAAGGEAAEAFTIRWLRSGTVTDAELDWAPEAWLRLSASPSVRVREEAVGRLIREEGRGRADEILATRVATETTWALRLRAIDGLFEPSTADGAEEALLLASHDDQPRVRAAATRRLAEIPGAEANRRLEVLLGDDPDPRVRRAARQALRLRLAARR